MFIADCAFGLGPMDEPAIRTAETRLVMNRLSARSVGGISGLGHWAGKAGAFGYQDRNGWLQVVEGSESNVIGLPMELLGEMLAQIGLPPPRHRMLDAMQCFTESFPCCRLAPSFC